MHPGVTAGHPRLRLGPPASVLAASLYYSGPRAPGRPNLEPCGRAPSIALPARTASGEPRRRRCTLTTSPGCSECPTSAPSSVTSSGASSTPLTVRRRWPPRVGDAGGKRLRPALTIACAGLGGIYDQRVVAAATAAELVQVGSLVHDDLLDGALTRRGTPTMNAVEGASTALLAGDFMLAQAGQLAASVGAGAASILATTISELCIGQTREMAQLSDPDRTIDEHLESIRGKRSTNTARSAGRERLEHGEHRDRHALGQLDVGGDVGARRQRLRQPFADVVLAPPRQRTEPVQRLTSDDADQVGPRVAHVRMVDVRPPQPRLLDDVLGVGRGAEHLVGDGEQQAAVARERVFVHADVAYPG